jgi:hypothetical protein
MIKDVSRNADVVLGGGGSLSLIADCSLVVLVNNLVSLEDNKSTRSDLLDSLPPSE